MAQAQRLLDEAGYVDRQDLGEIVVADVGLAVGPAVEVWRDELGVPITVESMEFADYFVALEEDPPQIFTINWIADYPSPYALYSLLLLPRAASNYGGWTDPTFVELLQTASAAEGDAAQAAAYREVDAYVDEQAPLIPWSYPTGWWLVRPGLRGLGNLTTGILDFGRVSWERLRRAGPLVVAVLLLGALPAPAFGFTGFSNLEADATFGEQMTFSVDLAGGAPDELELLMRFTGSDSTQVAPVQPNGDQATYVWDAAERYVVPNTEIAYQWRATDDGRTTLSAEESLLYDDDRPGLDWQSAVIGDATVHWYGGNEEVARHMGELTRRWRGPGRGAARPRAGRPGRHLRLRRARGFLRRAGTGGARVVRCRHLPAAAHHLHVAGGGAGELPGHHDRPRGDAYRLQRFDGESVP